MSLVSEKHTKLERSMWGVHLTPLRPRSQKIAPRISIFLVFIIMTVRSDKGFDRHKTVRL